MIRSGMPRDKAKIFAAKYQSFLASYGSIKGIFKMSRKFSKAEETGDVESNNTLDSDNPNNIGSLSIS